MPDGPSAAAVTASSSSMPVLPRGTVVFENIPVRAVVITALAPALGEGSLVVRDAGRAAIVLVRGGAVAEVHAFTADGRRSGEGLLDEVQGWVEAAVWAHRLEADLMAVCESLLTAEPLYDDLRLSWLSWPSLLADLSARGGAWLVEVDAAEGSGVLCVVPGRPMLAFTDRQPSAAAPGALDALVSGAEGSVRVRRLDSSAFTAPRPTVAASPEAALQPEPLAPTAVDATAANGDSESPGVADTTELHRAVEDALTDLAWVAPWETSWKNDAGNGAPAEPVAPRPVDITAVLPDLRSIAQRRLQLSASRVEAVLDQAADQHMPLDSVLDEIRSMSIRGVMQSTVHDMVDEMAATAAHRTG